MAVISTLYEKQYTSFGPRALLRLGSAPRIFKPCDGPVLLATDFLIRNPCISLISDKRTKVLNCPNYQVLATRTSL